MIKKQGLSSGGFIEDSSRARKMFFEKLKKFLPFPLLNIQTDKEGEFLKYFHKELEKQRVVHYFSASNCFRQNSKEKRVIQTAEEEFWNFNAACPVDELNRLANEWNHIYDCLRRPHQFLNYLTLRK